MQTATMISSRLRPFLWDINVSQALHSLENPQLRPKLDLAMSHEQSAKSPLIPVTVSPITGSRPRTLGEATTISVLVIVIYS